MTKQIEAVYEHGVLRPLEPIQLPEGTHLDVIVITRDKQQVAAQSSAVILSEIAALPLEGTADQFSGKDHDSILYPEKPAA
jgi:predicted DNA-binding antitoxin AbrB/MazE fold protein